MSPFLEEKKAIRKTIRVRLSGLDPAWAADASMLLQGHLVNFLSRQNTSAYRSVLGYAAAFPGEVDLSGFFEAAQSAVLYLPRVSGEGEMDFYSVSGWPAVLSRGKWGILEPEPEEKRRFDPAASGKTLVLVPGLAFTKNGERMGRGGGFYDRLLGDRNMEDTVTVGIAWSFQILDALPSGPFDRKVKWICTEEGCFQCPNLR